MQPHTEPCPMCGKTEDEYERKRKERETKKKEITAFIVGRRSVTLFSKRENEIFDAIYYLGIRDLQQVADNYGITYQAVQNYHDRAIDKLIDLDFELWNL